MILKKKNRYFILAVIVANTGIMFWTYHDQQKFELSICQAQKKKKFSKASVPGDLVLPIYCDADF